MTLDTETGPTPGPHRRQRSERLLETLAGFESIVLVSHVNPDPDALASMLGLEALLAAKLPGKAVTLTVDGMIARAENQAMVDFLAIPLVPVDRAPTGAGVATVMVDSQPRTGRHAREGEAPAAVLDHHETGGDLAGVAFRDLRPHLGATSTMVTGYLLEQGLAPDRRLATALLYGIESETTGYPREAAPADDGALIWLYPRADKDLLARIRHPKLPQSYFITYQHALSNVFLYRDLVVCWCGRVPQPDIVAELADFFIRFERVNFAMSVGLFDGLLKLSIRSGRIGDHCGELLRAVVDGLGTAGGHDRRAGGAIPVNDADGPAVDALLTTVRRRLLDQLKIADPVGRRLVESCPVIPAP
ncbi:MAG TPA: DHH family phosphoesterase [Isosphaeraceae bacterium]|jgi:nanoRNase/pAp phosphatase (c-di-AMP/oligoRNAs hydrolase)|nr:DHH family phosphoesterase [Isosphaeraceae bacterium]